MHILIAGKNSYIGKNIGQYILEQDAAAQVTYISVRDEMWKNLDLSIYDGVVFAAAIVHRKDVTDPEIYHKVNTVLPYEFAQKAKKEGVKRFLFLSTAAVYGQGKTLPVTNLICEDTPLAPVEPYGKSKLEAEQLLQTLEDEKFFVTLVRTINVYGKGCPGNYFNQLAKLAKMMPLHPKAYTGVKQGFIHVRSLARLCYLALNADRGGIYHAQDPEPVSTYEILQALSQGMGIRRVGLPCHTLMRIMPRVSPMVKLFGGVAYDAELARCHLGDYHVVPCRDGLSEIVDQK